MGGSVELARESVDYAELEPSLRFVRCSGLPELPVLERSCGMDSLPRLTGPSEIVPALIACVMR